MDEDAVKKYAAYVERIAWTQVFFGMLTQISSEYAFPSYNVVLGFWGAYCAFSKHGRATFGYITFEFLSLFLDVIFCSIYGSEGKGAAFKFSLAMFIICLVSKLVALYCASHFFSAIGGAYSMETNMGESAYDSLVFAREEGRPGVHQGKYYPPRADDGKNDLAGSQVF